MYGLVFRVSRGLLLELVFYILLEKYLNVDYVRLEQVS